MLNAYRKIIIAILFFVNSGIEAQEGKSLIDLPSDVLVYRFFPLLQHEVYRLPVVCKALEKNYKDCCQIIKAIPNNKKKEWNKLDDLDVRFKYSLQAFEIISAKELSYTTHTLPFEGMVLKEIQNDQAKFIHKEWLKPRKFLELPELFNNVKATVTYIRLPDLTTEFLLPHYTKETDESASDNKELSATKKAWKVISSYSTSLRAYLKNKKVGKIEISSDNPLQIFPETHAALFLSLLLHTNEIHVSSILVKNTHMVSNGRLIAWALEDNTSITDVTLHNAYLYDEPSKEGNKKQFQLKSFENMLANNSTLTKLDLQNSFLFQDAGNFLERGLKNNTTLVSLNLRGNEIGFEGVELLVKNVLSTNSTLKFLDLAGNIRTSWLSLPYYGYSAMNLMGFSEDASLKAVLGSSLSQYLGGLLKKNTSLTVLLQ